MSQRAQRAFALSRKRISCKQRMRCARSNLRQSSAALSLALALNAVHLSEDVEVCLQASNNQLHKQRSGSVHMNYPSALSFLHKNASNISRSSSQGHVQALADSSSSMEEHGLKMLCRSHIIADVFRAIPAHCASASEAFRSVAFAQSDAGDIRA